MKRYQITVGGRTFDVRILSDPRQEKVQVEVDGTALMVDAMTLPLRRDEPTAPSDATSTITSPGSEAAASGTLTAPLPGEIKSIAVHPGQQVEVGDKLLVIEAMKMDNVIRSPRGGTISAIHVVEGHRIAHADPLLDFQD